MTRKPNPALLERVKEIAPGFYTERDGGDWYALTPQHDRIAEDFAHRDDARILICWLAGDTRPKGWSLSGANDLSADLDCGQGYRATIWVRSVERAFPGRLAAMLTPARGA